MNTDISSVCKVLFHFGQNKSRCCPCACWLTGNVLHCSKCYPLKFYKLHLYYRRFLVIMALRKGLYLFCSCLKHMASFAHCTLPFFFRKGSLWRCWQASTEQWFVFASGQAVFEEDSHSSSKSSPALLLEMEQHTILSSVNLSSVLTPTCLSSPLLLLLASVHSSTLLLYRLICQRALLA